MAKMVWAQGTTATTGTTTTAAKTSTVNPAVLNQDFYNYLFIICGSLVVALFFWRVTMESIKYVRTMVSLGNSTQRYYAIPTAKWAAFKKHILYAPIFSKRHNREIQLSSALNVGTLPTRFQLLILAGYFGTNVAFCVVSIEWSQPFATAARELRNRTGILAVVNMVSGAFRSGHVTWSFIDLPRYRSPFSPWQDATTS
jgi:uncharacterized membrane protein